MFLYKSQTIFVKIPKYICVVDKKTEGGGGAKGSSGTMWLFGTDWGAGLYNHSHHHNHNHSLYNINHIHKVFLHFQSEEFTFPFSCFLDLESSCLSWQRIEDKEKNVQFTMYIYITLYKVFILTRWKHFPVQYWVLLEKLFSQNFHSLRFPDSACQRGNSHQCFKMVGGGFFI